MTQAWFEMALWLLIAGGVGASVRAGTSPIDSAAPERRDVRQEAAVSDPPYPVDSLALGIVSRDLFRFERRPAAVRYQPALGEGAATLAPPPRPQLMLRGLVLGDTSRALLEGLPGIEGSRSLRVGDVVAGLRLVAISQAQVRVVGLDTAWTLTLRRPQ
jgi:hypothetical protein